MMEQFPVHSISPSSLSNGDVSSSRKWNYSTVSNESRATARVKHANDAQKIFLK